MTTFTVTALKVETTYGTGSNGTTSSLTPNSMFEVVLVEPNNAFSYTLGTPAPGGVLGEPFVTTNAALLRTDGKVETGPPDFYGILQLDWNDNGLTRTTTLMIVVYERSDTVDNDYVFRLAGDPLPPISTAAEFDAWASSINTSTARVAPAPFAPGMDIPYASVPGTSMSEDDKFQMNGVLSNILDAGQGNDTIIGNDQDETLSGGAGNDSIQGNSGNDSLTDGAGNDTIRGGAGNDTVKLVTGFDMAFGGSERDLLIVQPPAANNGDYTAVVNLTSGRIFARENPTDRNDTINGFEDVEFRGAVNAELFGDGGNNQLTGSTGNDTLKGFDGNDWLRGLDGNDRLEGAKGNDTLDGGRGLDSLVGGAGADVLEGWEGRDTLQGGSGNDTLDSGGQNDQLYGGAGDDSLFGNSGNDSLWGGSGNDTLRGSDGNDKLWGGAGNNSIDGGGGNDSIVSTGTDTLLGGDGMDTIRGSRNADLIDAGGDADSVYAGRGNDQVAGWTGDDLIFGHRGADTIDGGAGNDTLIGGSGNDSIRGSLGMDSIDLGAGADVFVFSDGTDTVDGFVVADGDRLDLRQATSIVSLQDLYDNHVLDTSAGVLVFDGNGNSALINGILSTDLDAQNVLLFVP